MHSSTSSCSSFSRSSAHEETLLITAHIPHSNTQRIRNVAERRQLTPFPHKISTTPLTHLNSNDLPDIEACADTQNVVLGPHLRNHSTDTFTPLHSPTSHNPSLEFHKPPEQVTENLLTSLYLRKRRLTDHSLAKSLYDVLSVSSSSKKEKDEENDPNLIRNRTEPSTTTENTPAEYKKITPKQSPGYQHPSEVNPHTCTHITNSQLSSFPRFAMVSSLVELDLSSNRLTVLPDTLAFLAPTLRYLNLSGNMFTSFPPVLKKLHRLQCLVLSRNRLAGALPEDLPPCLQDLRVLRLCSNFLTSLPDTLSSLVRLRTLVLGSVFGGNRLTHFPPNCLYHMHHLRELDLSHNSIRYLPDDIGHPRSRLIRLSAADNRLTRIPKEIGRCTHLTSLNLARNLLTSLPCEIVDLVHLETLDLSENLLCILPGDIAEFMRKTTLLLAGNPFTRDPKSGSPAAASSPGNTTTTPTEPSLTESSVTSSLSSHRPDILGLGLGHDRSRALSRLLKLDVETTVEYDHDNGSYSPNAEDEEQEERDAREDLEFFLARHGRDPAHATSGERYYAPKGENGSTPYSSSEYLVSNSPGSSLTDRHVPAPTASTTAWLPSVNAFGYRPRSFPDTSGPLPQNTGLVTSDDMQESLSKSQSPSLFPSLRELAARTVLAASIPVRTDLLPPAVHAYLETGARPCSLCRRPYVKEWISCVQMGGFRGHPCVPRRVRYCSARCWEISTVALKEKERESPNFIFSPTSASSTGSGSGPPSSSPVGPDDPVRHHNHNHPYPLASPVTSPKPSRSTFSTPPPPDPPFTPCAQCPGNSHCPVTTTPARWRLRSKTAPDEDFSG